MLADGSDPHEWAYAWRTELNRGGFRAVDFLMDQVVAEGRGIGWASCVTGWPVDVFGYSGGRWWAMCCLTTARSDGRGWPGTAPRCWRAPVPATPIRPTPSPCRRRCSR